MSIKYNERGEVISVNGLTTGHFLGTPMQDALGTEEENSAYGTELKTVTRNENTVNDMQPTQLGNGSGGDGVFFVNFYADKYEFDAAITCDKSLEEVVDAVNNGRFDGCLHFESATAYGVTNPVSMRCIGYLNGLSDNAISISFMNPFDNDKKWNICYDFDNSGEDAKYFFD